MKVSELITKLQLCDQNAHVLVDKNNELGLHDSTFMSEIMGEAIVVAQGVAYKMFWENSGTDCWVSQEPWRYHYAGTPFPGTSAVYIGSGTSIVTPMWDKK